MTKRTTRMIITLAVLALNLTLSAAAAENPPKNVIVMIADGCGYNHIEAASLYQFGKTQGFAFYEFPVKYGMSTYPDGSSFDPDKAWADFDYLKKGNTDSAAAATAMATGVKTYGGAIGVDPNKQPVTNIIERCEQLGKSTGVITSVEWSHATPAGFAAHSQRRGRYGQISKQMIFESQLEVIMGAGNPNFDDDGNESNKPKYGFIESGTWDALVKGTAASDADGDGKDDPWTLIQTAEQFRKLMTGDTPKRICGTFQTAKTLQQDRSGDNNAAPYKVPLIQTVPSLSEMAAGAINVLDNDPDGFFLMIEGGAVDWASHGNQLGRMIEEEIEFSKAVDGVIEWVEKNSSWDQTLLIITADHETGYLVGPDSGKKDGRSIWNPLVNNGKGKMPTVYWAQSGHTNSLVPFFAKGAGSELFEKAATNSDPVHGKYIDNTDIAKTIFKLLE